MVSSRTVWGTLTVVTMAAVGVPVISILAEWVSDWGALLWICAAFFFPFITGVAWGPGGLGKRGRVAGALIGGALALAPGLGYAAIRDVDLTALRLPLLWALFTPLAMAQGTISLPVGAGARRRKAGSAHT